MYKIKLCTIEIDTTVYLAIDKRPSFLIKDNDKILQLDMNTYNIIYISNYTMKKADEIIDYLQRHDYQLRSKCEKAVATYKMVMQMNKHICTT